MRRFGWLLLSVPAFAAETPSLVIIYAQTHSAASRWVAIECDEAPVAQLQRGYFFASEFKPGRHSCTAADGVPVSFETVPGETAYLRLDWSHQVGRPPIATLKAVGKHSPGEIRPLRYIPPKRARSAKVLTKDPRPADPAEWKKR